MPRALRRFVTSSESKTPRRIAAHRRNGPRNDVATEAASTDDTIGYAHATRRDFGVPTRRRCRGASDHSARRRPSESLGSLDVLCDFSKTLRSLPRVFASWSRRRVTRSVARTITHANRPADHRGEPMHRRSHGRVPRRSRSNVEPVESRLSAAKKNSSRTGPKMPWNGLTSCVFANRPKAECRGSRPVAARDHGREDTRTTRASPRRALREALYRRARFVVSFVPTAPRHIRTRATIAIVPRSTPSASCARGARCDMEPDVCKNRKNGRGRSVARDLFALTRAPLCAAREDCVTATGQTPVAVSAWRRCGDAAENGPVFRQNWPHSRESGGPGRRRATEWTSVAEGQAGTVVDRPCQNVGSGATAGLPSSAGNTAGQASSGTHINGVDSLVGWVERSEPHQRRTCLEFGGARSARPTLRRLPQQNRIRAFCYNRPGRRHDGADAPAAARIVLHESTHGPQADGLAAGEGLAVADADRPAPGGGLVRETVQRSAAAGG